LAEDEKLVRKFVRSILEKSGYVLGAPRFGSAGGTTAPWPHPPLLTDMVMPLMDGNLGSTNGGFASGIRVLYMSGYSEMPWFTTASWNWNGFLKAIYRRLRAQGTRGLGTLQPRI
jgi:hypothetical protein